MCDPARCCALLLLMAAPAAPASAQQTEEELVRHLHAIAPLVAPAEAEARAARARRDAALLTREIAHIDTFTVGPLSILTPSDDRRTAEAFFRDVWEQEYAPIMADSPAFQRTTFTFQWAPKLGAIPVDGPVRRVEIVGWRSASAVREGVRNAISAALDEDRTPPITVWAQSSVRAPAKSRPAMIFREMVLSPARANRACLEGDARACWSALGLDVDDTPLDEWYTPEERRALAAARGTVRRDALTLRFACVDGHDTASCDAFLKRWGMVTPIQTMSPRGAMVWLALQAGGAGAWDRLRAAGSLSPGDALRLASGQSTDELASLWRRWMIEGAPARRAALDPYFLVTLLWIAVFAAFAMRSTRWRLR